MNTAHEQSVPRAGENMAFPERKKRVFQQGEYWYFHTREGVQVGPFDSEELAMKGAGDYVGFAVDADPSVLKKLSS